LLIVILLISGIRSGFAQSLNDIKIGHCTSATVFNAGTAANDIDNTIVAERKVGLVMDARPFAVDQSTGKLLFTRGDGRVSVVHMNPFVYDYRISVAQQELVSTALSDFLKLLLPPNLANSLGTQSGDANKAVRAAALPQLRGLERRLSTFTAPAACAATDRPCQAIR